MHGLGSFRRTIMVDSTAPLQSSAFAAVVARALPRRGIHHGWLMVALAFLFAMGSAAAMSVAVGLLNPAPDDVGWSIAVVSGALGLRMVTFGLMAPFVGRLIRSQGVHRMLTGSAILAIAGGFVAVTAAEQWQAWLALGVAMGITSGMTVLVMAATTAARQSIDRYGLVLGVLAAGNIAGQVIFLMPAPWLAQTSGWLCCLQ
jgi:Major Facilitator Superfamily